MLLIFPPHFMGGFSNRIRHCVRAEIPNKEF